LTWGDSSGTGPATRSRLFGRDEEIAAARRLLEVGTRLVTITGAGGIGKTRVALEVCRKVSGKVSFIELSGTDDAGLPGTLTRALVPEPDIGADLAHSIAMALIGEPHVVVLDTFEHLLASAPLLDDMLEACPDLQLLVTSRARLRLSGENVVQVAPLPTAAGGAAVAMFLERARAVGGLRPGDAAGDEESTVAALCELLDGSPLAIELAAARTVMFTPAALLAALQSGEHSQLRMLADGSASGRHRGMQDTIAWSYELLGEPSRRLLRRLAVFAGSFDLGAAATVCKTGSDQESGGPDTDPSDVLDDLADLIDWHLVEPGGGPADAPRFRLLDLLREFAARQLRCRGEVGEAEEGLLRWSAVLADRAIAGFDSPAERDWLERIDGELPNLRSALALLEERADAPRGMRVAAALGPFWANRGPKAEGRRWFEAFLAMGSQDPKVSAHARAACVTWSARLAIDEGELDLRPLAAARDVLAQEPKADTEWLRATEHLAYGLTMRGELAAADELTEAGIERATLAGLPYWRCVFLQRRAHSAQRHSRPDLAIRYARQAVLAAQAIGYERMAARAEQIITIARAAELGPEGMRLALIANLRAYERAGDLRGVVSTMANLGALLADTDVPAAAQWISTGLDAGISSGYWHGQAYCVVAAVFLTWRAGQLPDAARLYCAMRPYLTTLQASMPPEYYADYQSVADSVREQLGAAAFDQATAELAEAWPVVRGYAAAIARRLATDSDVTEPAEKTAAAASARPRVRHRGPRSNPDLTERELEVLAAIATGETNPQIAAVLHLSPKTVMHHSTSVYRKLGVRGRAEAVALAYRTGLLPS
jgi:predicted ATPase/DNA-binding CsgD family transcriptional regulator